MRRLWLIVAACGAPDAPTTPHPAACPSTFAEATQARPSCAGAPSCRYPEGVCDCTQPCSGWSGARNVERFECRQLPAACPASPAEGAPCPQLGLTCEYVRVSSCGGTIARCEATGWVFDVISKAG